MRFFDHRNSKKAESTTYGQKVVLLPRNHFQTSPETVNKLQNELELRAAQQFKNSVAALIQSKKTPKPSIGLFALPKPKPQFKFEKDIKPTSPKL